MKRFALCTLAVCLSAVPAAKADETSQALAMAAQHKNAMAMVALTMENELGKRVFGGQAICIVADQGIFLSLAVPPGLKPEDIKDCKLIIPGDEGKEIPAKLLGVDPNTRLSFFQAQQKHDWGQLSFQASSGLSAGQQVVSLGLMGDIAGFPAAVGSAYVSTFLRVPDSLVYVTGGRLTGGCSPVFTTDGKVIGLVGRQLFRGYQTLTQRGAVRLDLAGEDECAFFWPVEEFISVIINPPTAGKVNRPSWIGVASFADVPPEIAELSGVTDPAVKIDRVVAGRLGEKAGFQGGDIIVAMNGQKIERLANPSLTRQNFIRQLVRLPAGTKLELTVVRSRKPVTLTVTTEPLPTTPEEAEQYLSKTAGMLVRDRVDLETDIDPTATEGLVVLGTAQNSPAAAAGLRPGDVIFELNGKKVAKIAVFKPAFEKSLTDATKSGQWPIVKVQRGEGALDIQIRPVPPQPGQ